VHELAEQRLERYRRALSGVSCPATWVDLDLFEANIEKAIAFANGKLLRIGTKSIRSRALIELILKKIPSNCGLMTMSARETLWLSELGFKNLLIGYPVVNAGEIDALAKAVAHGAKITVMADLHEHLELYQAAASANATVLSVCLDLDVSTPIPGIYFGVHRSSLLDIEKLQAISSDLSQWPNLKIEGLMGYEAQIAGVQDRPAQWWIGPIVRWLKSRSLKRIAEKRETAVAALKEAGLKLRFVNGGGTGSLKSTSLESAVSEVTVGSAFLAPALFDHYADFRFQPACGFALEVTRHSHAKTWTCLAGGYIASGTGTDRAPVPYLPEGLKLLPNEGAGEVQTPIHSETPLELGQQIFFRHAKAGELMERFKKIHLIRGDKVVDVVATYRGEDQCFL
jgi:D-serine deaminase-like pyridoxal phosphate-dependent protein